MGEAPELRGFFLGCGFNSAGEGAYESETRRHLLVIQRDWGRLCVVQSAALLEGM